MRQHGKRYTEWIRERDKPGGVIDSALKSGEITRLGNGRIVGYCKDCGRFKDLTPDHKVKRSQGGQHTSDNIDWVCIGCHDMRDNKGDPNKAKPASKKADWSKSHQCNNCKQMVSTLLCTNCGKMSV